MAFIGGQDIGKPAKKRNEILEEKREKAISEIRKILDGAKGRDLKDEEKKRLGVLYSNAAQATQQLAELTADKKTKDAYEKEYRGLLEKADKYSPFLNSKIPDTTFDDIGGLEEVKSLAKSFLFMAKNPQIMQYYKMEGGLGMLLYGAPGTGKTMFAEAIAHEMKLPLFIVSPADIFKSYVGESEQAVKQLFQEIDSCQDGAILFIDECESIFSRRTSDTKDYKAAVTNELLQRINGFGVDGSKRIMIAATNRPDLIDSAYLRYKRFSHLVHVPPPDRDAKEAIIRHKMKDLPLSGVTADDVLLMSEVRRAPAKKNLDLDDRQNELSVMRLATGYWQNDQNPEAVATPDYGYYSGADLCGIIEEASRMALELSQREMGDEFMNMKEDAILAKLKPITKQMFEAAFQKIPPSISAKTLQEYKSFR